jgi:alkaline phosphatase D
MESRREFIGMVVLGSTSLAMGQSSSDYGQFGPPDAFTDDPRFPYYGSENEWSRRMFNAAEAATDNKRLGQRLLLAILDGQPGRCVEMCQEELERSPNDVEALFVLTCAWSKLGEPGNALEAARKAVAAGLPVERFLAGPVELLGPLTGRAEFRELLGSRVPGLVHGPMLGVVTHRSARVWLRTANEQEAIVRVYDGPDSPTPVATAAAKTRAASDRTAVLEVAGLQPDAEYYYDLTVDGVANGNERATFRTAPPPGQRGTYRVAFGGCSGYTPHFERMWRTILAKRPQAMLTLGDNVYIDMPEEPGPFHRYSYYCRQARPEWRELAASTPIYAIWDDHDCGIDDIWLGPYVDRPAFKPGLLKLFKQNWNNPRYGNAAAPGVWFDFTIGDVDFFMLDCRYYRTNPYAPQRTMLGPEQKRWLLDGLTNSTATFKVIASSVAWSHNAKPGSRDTWDGFPDEREEIFATIDKHRVGGVLLLSGDRHRTDAWRIERSSGYDLYEVCSSRLTNIHTHECVPGALFCYNEKCSFGLIDFDTQSADPSVTISVVNIDGETVHTLPLKRSQLEPR